MSFCPNKDIHSVYLDNELPKEHKIKYEKHLEECAECRKELAKLRAVHYVFEYDAESVTPDEQFLKDSYERLMIKMSYNKNTGKNKKNPILHFTYIVSAAAAVMFALIIPVGLRKNNTEPQLNPVNTVYAMPQMGNNISFGSGKNVVVSGNIDADILSSHNYDLNNENLFEDMSGIGMLKTMPGEDNVISIRVTIPNMGEIPIGRIYLEGLVTSGNNEWNLLEN